MKIIILTCLCLVSSFQFSSGNRRIDWIMKKIQATSSQLGQLEYDVFQIEKEIDDKFKFAQHHHEADFQTEVSESVADILRGQNVDDMLSGRIFEEVNALRQSFHQFKVRFHDLSTHLRNLELDKDHCLKETRKLYLEKFAKIQNQQLVMFTGQKEFNSSLSLLQNDLKNILKEASRDDEEGRRVDEKEDLEKNMRQQIQDIVSKGNEDGRRIEERLKQVTKGLNEVRIVAQENLRREISQRDSELGRLKNQVQNLMSMADQTKGSKVLFTAYLSKATTFNNGNKIIFDNVESNIGNGYNPHSGFFTAPVSGYYAFTVILVGKGSGNADFGIKNQNGFVAFVIMHGGWTTGTMSTTAHVRKGNHVYVMMTMHNGKRIVGTGSSQFAGHLLLAD